MTELVIISAVVVLVWGLIKALPPAVSASWDVRFIKRKSDMDPDRLYFIRLQEAAGAEIMTFLQWMGYPAWVFASLWLYA